MRRALAWTAGIVGIAALARWLRGRARESEAPVGEPVADPAGELRRALDESRAPEPTSVPPEEAATADDASIDDRRADVHARAESAIARMREGDG
jgi:hypothetical protein